MKPGPASSSNQAGFTLVETLVALALLSLMTAFATGAIAIMSRTKQIEAKLAQRSKLEAVERHLAQTLSDMRIVYVLNPDQSARPAFRGESGLIEFIAPLSDRLERGGLYWLRYGVDDRGVFALQYQVFRPQGVFNSGASEPLLPGVDRVRFRYFGRPEQGAPPGWSDTWVRKGILPQAVSLEIGLKAPSTESRMAKVIAIPGGD
jgi:prepilin-type N-terminal cleavage/methylation domain-containing protein